MYSRRNFTITSLFIPNSYCIIPRKVPKVIYYFFKCTFHVCAWNTANKILLWSSKAILLSIFTLTFYRKNIQSSKGNKKYYTKQTYTN